MIKIVSLSDVIDGRYTIPDFQRDYAWSYENLKLMLDDIGEAFREGKERYLLGPIVVSEDKGKSKRVIDGQQRLTSIMIVLRALGRKDINFLGFDNRKHVEDLFSDIDNYEGIADTQKNRTCGKIYQMYRLAVSYFEKNRVKEDYLGYLLNRVCFIEKTLETPNIQHSFEVLNTAGEQLKPEDVAKAKLIADISKFKHNEWSELLNTAWLICYDNENELRGDLKGKTSEILNVNSFPSLYDALEGLESFISNDCEYTKTRISDIVSRVESEKVYSRIIDGGIKEFTSGKYSVCLTPYELIDVALKASLGKSISEIVKSDAIIENENVALDVVKQLLLYRIAFDKYVVRREKGKWNWALGTEINGDYAERFIKIASMMAVSGTEPSKKMLEIVEKAMIKPGDFNVKGAVSELENYAIDRVNKVLAAETTDGKDALDMGTGTDHFVFHWLDYLLWLERPEKIADKVDKFNFKETSSIEHFMPQHLLGRDDEGVPEEWETEINKFGNLALITPSLNSRQNNSSPEEKSRLAAEKGELESLKYELMMDIARSSGWTVATSIEHGREMRRLLADSENIVRRE
jgi:hypothetical protein